MEQDSDGHNGGGKMSRGREIKRSDVTTCWLLAFPVKSAHLRHPAIQQPLAFVPQDGWGESERVSIRIGGFWEFQFLMSDGQIAS